MLLTGGGRLDFDCDCDCDRQSEKGGGTAAIWIGRMETSGSCGGPTRSPVSQSVVCAVLTALPVMRARAPSPRLLRWQPLASRAPWHRQLDGQRIACERPVHAARATALNLFRPHLDSESRRAVASATSGRGKPILQRFSPSVSLPLRLPSPPSPLHATLSLVLCSL